MCRVKERKISQCKLILIIANYKLADGVDTQFGCHKIIKYDLLFFQARLALQAAQVRKFCLVAANFDNFEHRSGYKAKLLIAFVTNDR
jgi:hypothetical protein